MISLPTLLAIPLDDELFHRLLLVGVVPLSAFALLMGCRKHKNRNVVIWGGAGLLVMIFAAFLGHDLVGETGEKGLTLLGSALIIVGHYGNYRLCRVHHHCEC